METWVLIASFFVILAGLVSINAKVNGGFKIETPWVAIALLPGIFWLVHTGKVAGFSGFGLEIELREAAAGAFDLERDGDSLGLKAVDVQGKEDPGKIKDMIARRVEALSFELGRTGYYQNEVILQYLQELTPYDFFRYILFVDSEGSFQALMRPKDLLYQIQHNSSLDMARVIGESGLDELKRVQAEAVHDTSNKRDALERMQELEVAELPVVDDENKFLGILERDKLTSSILLQLVAKD